MKILFAILAAASVVSAADLKLGKPLVHKELTSIADLASKPDSYVGQTVQVKGKIVEVCQKMGCWMDLADDSGKKVHIKVEDGVIVFPKDSAGRTAVAEGKLSKIELTREEAIARAKEEAGETGRKFDPESIKSGVTIYQIDATGAVILEK